MQRVRSTQKLPMPCADLRGEAADQRDRDRDAGGGRDEVLHGQARHLREIAHRRFADVACQLVLVVKLTAVLKARAQARRKPCGLSGSEALRPLQ